ncbi:MAG TPA: hypothetical protein VHM24_14595, partial [Gemmatimonadaceae bacterium]|nr:hypothetical protein [Gemmatimonadaceae bacterium]
GPGGKPLGMRPVDRHAVMTVEECGRQIVDAIRNRRRQVVMTPRAKLGMILKAFAPEVVDRMAARAIERGR